MSAQDAVTKNGITKGTLGVVFPALPLIAIGVGVGLGWLVVEGLLRLPFALGIALGIALFHGSFGFAQAYRGFLSGRGGDAVLAHVVVLAAATILFAPVLAQGSAFGNSVVGAMAPFGASVAFGAFLFGIGMQLGGACASGCLYTVGGGNTRALVTLVAFCIGAFIGSLHLEWWLGLPSAGELSFSGLLGWELAVPVQLALLAAIAIILRLRFHAGLGFDRPRGARLADRPVAAHVCGLGPSHSELADPDRFRPSLEHHVGFHPVGSQDRADFRLGSLFKRLLEQPVSAGGSKRRPFE